MPSTPRSRDATPAEREGASPDARPGAPPPAGPTHVGTAPQAPGSSPRGHGGGLPLPHERDEAAGQVAATPDPVIVQAKKDLDAGMVDTDMRVTPGLDAARRKAMVSTPLPQRSAGLPDTGAEPGESPKARR